MLNPYAGGEFNVTQIFTLGAHNGMDIVGVSSKQLTAICDGVVYQSTIVRDKSDLTWQWGNYVTIKDGGGNLIVYAHLSQRMVAAGQTVRRGDVIGIEGNTGYSFGSHCHLEVRNPANKATSVVNTPQYTTIPNAVGYYRITDGEEKMSDSERAEMDSLALRITNLENSQQKRYHYWDELPEWAYSSVRELYDAGLFSGRSPSDLDISENMMRMLTVIAAANHYGE